LFKGIDNYLCSKLNIDDGENVAGKIISYPVAEPSTSAVVPPPAFCNRA
jgi:hypothetical protein